MDGIVQVQKYLEKNFPVREKRTQQKAIPMKKLIRRWYDNW